MRELWLQACGDGLWQEKFAGIGRHFIEAAPEGNEPTWYPHSKMPKAEDFGELELIQIYDTQYKFTFNMAKTNFVAMRPEWVWRRITPPPQSAPPGPKSSGEVG